MTAFRTITLVLAVLQVLFAAFTGMVGAFADGGSMWERLLLIVVHPLCAVALLVLTLLPKPPPAFAYVVAALLVGNIFADLTLSQLIGAGTVKGDWWLPLMFSVIPAVGLAYALTLAKQGRNASP
ncbi:MAG: hypothetical protein F4Y50_02870 [Dehalococcoidia bacterium]|nr:hypothetical protein [Dehalococcoidia bacterium]